jgi:hypothetical protein
MGENEVHGVTLQREKDGKPFYTIICQVTAQPYVVVCVRACKL